MDREWELTSDRHRVTIDEENIKNWANEKKHAPIDLLESHLSSASFPVVAHNDNLKLDFCVSQNRLGC